MNDVAVSPMLMALFTRKLDTIEKAEIAIELLGAPRHASTIEALAQVLQVGPGILRTVVAEMANEELVSIAGDAVQLICGGAEADLIAEATTLFASSRPEMLRLFARIARERGQKIALRLADDALWLRARKNRIE